jgi:uncharacterized protein YbjT (DUF2867 family)
MKTILVSGATGNLGQAVIVALRNKGIEVRAGGRDTQKLNAVGGNTVVFDYANHSTLSAALQDVVGLFLVAPPLDGEAPAKLKPVIDTAKSRGVRHIVFNSALGVDAVEQAPLRVCERYLMGSGVPYTIIRPNFFMENFSTGFLAPMVKTGAIYLAADNAKTSFISVVDIAEVAATVFAQALTSKEYDLTGPEALDHTQVAATISQVSGKRVAYQPIPEEAMLKGLRGT